MRVVLAITRDAELREVLRRGIEVDDVLVAEHDLYGAVRRLNALQVDGVLVDQSAVHDANKLELLRTAAPNAPLLVIFSNDTSSEQIHWRQAGVSEVLTKPLNCEALFSALDRYSKKSIPKPFEPPSPTLSNEQDRVLRQNRALRWLGRTMLLPTTPETIAQRLTEGILDIFDASRCAVFLEQDGLMAIAAAYGIQESVRDTLRLRFTHGILRCLDMRATLIHYDNAPGDAHQEMSLLQAEVIVPLIREGKVFGVIAIGGRSTSAYCSDDYELMNLIAQSSVPFFNTDNRTEVTVPEESTSVIKASIQDTEIDTSPFWEYLSNRVAQEIKNPMVAINTFAQLLPRKYESEEFRDAFSKVVQTEVLRINNVVETLFSFARHPEPERHTCTIHKAVEDALRVFDEELATRNIVLETQWDDGGTQVEVDPIYFSKALHNIMQNAIEAMPEGGRIRVETHRVNGTADVIVKDTGPGIEPGDEAQIFLPFFSTRERGMGLGLPIAKRILNQHGGKLSLLSEENEGCTFILKLPAVNASPETDKMSEL